ncbi:MAG: MATE family efflux transporter [Candidatus Ventricola sp.]
MSVVSNTHADAALGTERVSKLMLRFAVPSVISMVVNSIYNLVDQIFIGQGVGYLGNAGTNVVMPMSTFLMALTMMIGAGTATYISLNLGRGDPDRASRGASNAITVTVIIGIVTAIVFELFMEQLCRLFGATDGVLPYAMAYGRIIVLGFPFSAIDCAFGDMIRADCRPRESMAGLLIGCITNIILDPVFIFVFHWGVEGAALATVIGQALNAVYYIWCASHFTTIRLEKRYFKPQWKTVRSICTLGVSNFITQISSVVVMTVLNNLVTIYGAASEFGADIPLAVLGIVTKVNNLATGIVLGIATGCQPILSYNYGSGQYSRVKSTFKYAVIVAFLVMTVTRIIFWLFPEQIISLFGRESDLYVAFAVKCFNIFLLAIPLTSITVVSSVLFQSIGKAGLSAFLSLTRQFLYFIPIMLILAPILGLDGILWGASTSDTLSCITAVILVAVNWKKMFKQIY